MARAARPHAPAFSRAVRTVSVLFVALAVGASGVAAASTTTTSTTTTTTTATTTATTTPTTTGPTVPPTTAPPPPVVILPPPPPFPLGDDFGRLILQHRAEGTAALAQANVDVSMWTGQLAMEQENVKVAQDAHDRAVAHARAVARKLVAIKRQIKVLAADAYMMGSSVQLTGALSSFTSANSFVALSRNLTLVTTSHDRLHDLVDYERHEQVRAARGVDDAERALSDANARLQSAQASLGAAQQRKVDATAELQQAGRDQARFFADATDSASPIMGPTRLTAADLVAYIDSLRLKHPPHLTVPLRVLAGYYISEGEAEGVRGDVAFAQSILETGAFTFPGHGLLVPTDNNFAGIDACDSCRHGDLFKTAQLGVRAQIQLLRVYADPTLKKIEQFAHPVALLHEPHLGGSGHSRTWYSLGGTWATGPNYGFHVYDIYLQILALAQRRAREANLTAP